MITILRIWHHPGDTDDRLHYVVADAQGRETRHYELPGSHWFELLNQAWTQAALEPIREPVDLTAHHDYLA